MSKFVIVEGAAQISKAIVSIATRGTKLDHDIHRIGVSVLVHATEHGDTSLCDKLVHAMPKGARKLALVEWMLAFGQVRKLDPKTEKEAIDAGRIFQIERKKDLMMDKAIETPWTEFKKEAPVLTAFDAQDAVHKLMARLDAAVKGGKQVQNVDAAIRETEALLAALQGAKGKAAALANAGEAVL